MATMATKEPPLGERPSLYMAPSRLHNFIFPTAGWGAGRTLRCRKEQIVDSGESGGSLEEIPSPSKVQSISPEPAENSELPWNLRRRRAFSKGESSKSIFGESGKGKRKLSISLSFKEIEADFQLMNGKKPHKRPKKRPRHLQKQLNVSYLFHLSLSRSNFIAVYFCKEEVFLMICTDEKLHLYFSLINNLDNFVFLFLGKKILINLKENSNCFLFFLTICLILSISNLWLIDVLP
jgi:Protein of unknown function (DUF1639)